MRKIISTCCLSIFVLLFFSCHGMAGKPFEGVITYKISYPDTKYSESQMAMAPKLLTVSIKGSKSRTDMQVSGANTVALTDFTEKTSVSLYSMMGQKYAIKQTTAEIESSLASQGKITVVESGETKVIAGYTCKKVVVTLNDDGATSTYEAYYSSELGSKQANFNNPLFKDIDGALLEFTMKAPMGTMKLTATSIEKKSLQAKDFEIPSDYTLTTMDELKSKFGGGND